MIIRESSKARFCRPVRPWCWRASGVSPEIRAGSMCPPYNNKSERINHDNEKCPE